MLTIHMFPDGQVQLVDQREIPHSTRYVSLESVIEVFQNQIVSSPTLPSGCIQYWRGHGFSVVALQHPAHQRDMLMEQETFHLPVPDTLFVFRVRHDEPGEITLGESAVFAMDGPWRGEETQLYEFPYGNVFDDMTICWGDFDVTLPNFHHIDTMMDMFLGTPFNTDLAGSYQSPGTDVQSLYSFWEEMRDKPIFPIERLIPYCRYKELPDKMAAEMF